MSGDPLDIFFEDTDDDAGASESAAAEPEPQAQPAPASGGDDDLAAAFDVSDEPAQSAPAAPASAEAEGSGARRDDLNPEIFTRWARPKGRLLLCAVRAAFGIGKLQINLGHKADGDQKMQFVSGWVDAVALTNWLQMVRYASAGALGGDNGRKFAQYGGSTMEGQLVSRAVRIDPADRENREAEQRFYISVVHAPGMRSDSGAVMPKRGADPIARQNMQLGAMDLAELGLRCELALTSYAANSTIADMTELLGGGRGRE